MTKTEGILATLGLLIVLLACSSKGKALPGDVPIYPGAEEKTNLVSVGIHNVMHQTDADGSTVKGWYDANLAAAWTPRLSCGSTWKKRRELLGMHFENRCFKSKARDEFLQVEVAYKPGEKTTIRTRSCPGNRGDRCMGKP